MCFHSDTVSLSRRASCSRVNMLGKVKDNQGLIRFHTSPSSLLRRGGVQLSDISIYPQSSCAPESSDQQTPAPPHPPWFHKPANQLLWPSGQIVSALSMPSAKRLVAFWAVVAKPPGIWSHNSQHGPTNLLSLLPHTFLHMPLKKFLRLPARRSRRSVGFYSLCVWSSAHSW